MEIALLKHTDTDLVAIFIIDDPTEDTVVVFSSRTMESIRTNIPSLPSLDQRVVIKNLSEDGVTDFPTRDMFIRLQAQIVDRKARWINGERD